ncbi:glutamate synthase large subunit [Wenzhouxiangella sp. XN79A]|uniref:glutamate synthase large subunit n=1 Tax=Wenzhouxiangella sp. XN79A TaxID=2724193 RepID=UPI00144AA0D0|nr:glutamate synthase large subunit [Wenzhouxiangella sp. XN79A]NKI36580.1 glutamate synthase large subunit [Wenzhouxiangella sp. XN79A]
MLGNPPYAGVRSLATLYHPDFEHDACGFGLIARLDGRAEHRTVADAVQALNRLTHRGAVAPDGKTGDGCGLLIGTPRAFLRAVAAESGLELPERFAVGQLFLDHEDGKARAQRKRLVDALDERGLAVAGWRTVPVDLDALGEKARATCPRIEQVFVTAADGIDDAELQRRLFIARRRAEAATDPAEAFYIASLSATTLSYKGMVMPEHLPAFFPDLADERLETSVALFHQRFSTNTLPRWRLAQPFRLLAHNGEINTIRGNRNWARARRHLLASPDLPEIAELDPPVDLHGSDSSSLDQMLELLVIGGMPLPQALRLLIPPAWQTADNLDADKRAFHEYFAFHQEPWDGPAGLVITDGRWVVCGLDRNGLRPARWTRTTDDRLIVASETGVVDVPVDEVVARGRLGPGELLAADLVEGRLETAAEIDDRLKTLKPWQDWLKAGVRYLDSELVDVHMAAEPFDADTLATYQKMFNLSREERREVIQVLAETQSEAIGSMGDDTPMPVLSTRIRSLFDSCRQQFAQVTNPPIDSLRERIVMSLETGLGRKGNVFDPTPEMAERVVLNSPVLSQRKLRQLVNTPQFGLDSVLLDLNVAEDTPLDEALDDLCRQASEAVEAGKLLLILSDRYLEKGKLPVHALLACGAVHHHLLATGQRPACNLIVETGTARDPHHFACLIGFGATAVYPYLVYQTLQDMVTAGEIEHPRDHAMQLGRAYRRGIRKGLFKILSKMGISTIGSYRGAQLFELVGLDETIVQRCFPGAVSRLGGATFDDLWADQKALARWAWDLRMPIEHGGLYRYVHGGEYHAWNPDVVTALRTAAQTGQRADYQRYKALVDGREPSMIRDLLRLRSDHASISVEDVEPVTSIVKRFDSAGMSLGALSPEAHEALAIAMNRLGARSNSGEGGEDPARYGTEKASKIKQVASGRFGVTPDYLVSAEVIQIKIAQGAKPGEGGQLPGHKVDGLIARLRFATPGVGLISPPPHHDIYSIEDLAQLIYDLKEVNPTALVSVKLVAEPGVGTIAAGVVKAYADLITISGYDGGTGASPLTSVKYAGAPWETGLAEVRQVLRANGLRGQVRIQADGGLKTGTDVLKAAALGAESFGFGTAPMIALGCKYLRICHLNNCATGVATQNAVLREKHFVGLPDMVVNYMLGVAEDVREGLAALGLRSLDELIGRTEYLERCDGLTARQNRLDLAPLLDDGEVADDVPRACRVERNPPHDPGALAARIAAATSTAVAFGTGGEFAFTIHNHDRSIGARLSGEIARRHGADGLTDAPLTLTLTGTAGQSLGAFNAAGLRIQLTGEANDYVGKGMAGGRIVLRPPAGIRYRANLAPIMGNTCLYGATGGELFAAGTAGERFAVRNSGAVAVVEGTGDHGCEYMTGGVAVILGRTGINFGAGMTGGFAYVLDLDRGFVDRYNHELIDIHHIEPESMESHVHHLRNLITRHRELTGSAWASEVLDDFRRMLPKFWLVTPKATDLEVLIRGLREAA